MTFIVAKQKNFFPILPPELWQIIFDYKERLEIRDDCIVDSKRMKLRSGKVIYKDNTRMQRFLNKVSFILFSIDTNNNKLKIKKITDMMFEDYIFIIDNIDYITKKNKSISRLLGEITTKIYDFRNVIKYTPQDLSYKMDINDMNYCLFLLEKCIYFLENYECIRTKCSCNCGNMILNCSHFKHY